MIDIVTSFTVSKDGHEDEIICFGKLDETAREIELHYELNSVGSVLMRAEDFWGRRLLLSVKSTDAQIYIVYGCFFSQQTLSLSSSGMGTLTGHFESLIKQESPFEKYHSTSFSFVDIEKIFPLINFQISTTDYYGPVSISRPALAQEQHTINDTLSAAIISHFNGLPSDSCTEIHINQNKYITINSETEKTAIELLDLLSSIKQYIEFLCSQEIQLRNISFSSKKDTGYSLAEVVTAPLLIPNTFVKKIDSNPYRQSEEDFFAGLQGWLENNEKYKRVLEIWKKTIYNTNVSDEDIFVWRCQAFELLCALTDEIKDEAYSNLAPDQSNPNVRNYLTVVSSRYDIAKSSSAYFSDVKDVRDKLTHNNPKKTVTEDQIKNAYGLINHFLIATIAMIMGIKCRLPMFILKPKK